VPIVLKLSASLNLLEPLGPVEACTGIALLLDVDKYNADNNDHDHLIHSPHLQLAASYEFWAAVPDRSGTRQQFLSTTQAWQHEYTLAHNSKLCKVNGP